MKAEKTGDVSDWWSSNPQTYGDQHGRALYGGEQDAIGDAKFFEHADRTLFDWNAPLHSSRPFDRIFPYERYRGKRVLEIGCGMGAMAGLWAAQGADVTAVDLAPMSVQTTQRRFSSLGLAGNVIRADGRMLPFNDGEFDYVYSWGVLHHSPDLARSLREMMRVLKQGGQFGLMLYHRHSFYYHWRVRYLEGFVHKESDFLDPVALASRYTDGSDAEGNPHTWPVTRAEVHAMLAPYVPDIAFRVLGTEVDEILEFMLPGFGRLMPRWALKPWARRLGWSLWSCGTRS